MSSFHLLPLDVTTIHQQSSRFSGVWEQVHMPPFTMCARYCIALPLLMTVIVVSLRLAGSNSRKEHLRLMELLPGFLVSNMEKSTPSSCYPELTLTRMAWIHNVSRCVQRTRIVFRPSITNSYSFSYFTWCRPRSTSPFALIPTSSHCIVPSRLRPISYFSWSSYLERISSTSSSRLVTITILTLPFPPLPMAAHLLQRTPSLPLLRLALLPHPLCSAPSTQTGSCPRPA